MKNSLIRWLPVSLLMSAPVAMFAAETPVSSTWHAQSLGQAVGYMALFAIIGIVLAIVGYRVFDMCTPGNLHKEIVENQNTAAAIIGGAVILGVCIIIAAAMLG